MTPKHPSTFVMLYLYGETHRITVKVGRMARCVGSEVCFGRETTHPSNVLRLLNTTDADLLALTTNQE